MSNSKSEDTPLYETEDSKLQGLIDWILFEPAYTPVDMKEKILAWHKAEIAKLFEQIRSEAVRMDKPWGDGSGYDLVMAVDEEALTRIESR